MDIPDIRPDSPDRDPPAIDLTDQVIAVERYSFRVDDRVERLSGRSEQARWGTITCDADGDTPGSEWLVVDNAGVTHHDRSDDLSRAIRGQMRNPVPLDEPLETGTVPPPLFRSGDI